MGLLKPIHIVSSQLYVCHILVSKKCQLQAGTIHPYWGKELLTQQLTGSSTQTQPCDNAMSMVKTAWYISVQQTVLISCSRVVIWQMIGRL